MIDPLLNIKELQPQLEARGFNLDIIRLDRIAYGDAMSLAEKILSFEQAEFYLQGRIVCEVFAHGHQSSDEFDELFMRTTRDVGNRGMAYKLDIVPFLDGKVQQYFLQYTNMVCNSMESFGHNDSKSGYGFRADIIGLSLVGSKENLIDTSTEASTLVIQVFEPRLHQDIIARGQRTKTYRIISAN